MHISEVFGDFRPKFNKVILSKVCDNLLALCPEFPVKWVIDNYDVEIGIRNSIAKYEGISDYARVKLNLIMVNDLSRNLLYSIDGMVMSVMAQETAKAVNSVQDQYHGLDLIPKLYSGIPIVISGEGIQGIHTGTITNFDSSMRVYYLSMYKPQRDKSPNLRYFATANEEDITLKDIQYQNQTTSMVRASATKITMQGFSFEQGENG